MIDLAQTALKNRTDVSSKKDWVVLPPGLPYLGVNDDGLIRFKSGREILDEMHWPKERPGRIFVHTHVSSPGFFGIIERLKSLYPLTPIYGLGVQPSGLASGDFTKIGLSGWVTKDPSLYRKELNEIDHQASALTIELASYEHPNLEVEQGMIQVPASDLLHHESVTFDVYLLSPSQRFVCIQGAGQRVQVEKMAGYIEKGVEYFYISQNSVQSFIQYLRFFKKQILEERSEINEVVLLTQLQTSEDLFKAVLVEGLTPAMVEKTSETLFQVQDTLRRVAEKSPSTLKAAIKGYVSSIEFYEHSVSVMLVANLIAFAGKVKSASLWSSLGTASFLHDIGLYQISEHLLAYEGVPMHEIPKEELELFTSHPDQGAELLAQSGEFDPLVVQLVKQHHERRDGSGFPGKVKLSQIHPLAELIGAAEDITVQMIRVAKVNKHYDFGQSIKWFLAQKAMVYSPSLMEQIQELYSLIK